jgi:hypothetical protein
MLLNIVIACKYACLPLLTSTIPILSTWHVGEFLELKSHYVYQLICQWVIRSFNIMRMLKELLKLYLICSIKVEAKV